MFKKRHFSVNYEIHEPHERNSFPVFGVLRGSNPFPDYTDSAPLPAAGQSALWKYKAIYLQADQRVGQWSDVVSIPVAGWKYTMTTCFNFKFALPCKYEAVNFEFVLKLAVCLATICLFQTSSLAEEFQANGALKIQQFDLNNKIISEKNELFEVSVKDCKWHITTMPILNSNENEDIDSWEIGSDGNDEIYQISILNKKKLSPKSLNDAIGLVENENVPQNIQGNQITELWLAFASGCYLDGITNGMLKPVYNLSDPSLRSQGYADTGYFERFNAKSKLPSYVAYTNKQMFGFLKGKPIFMPLPPPFENGFVRAEYKVMTETNIGGLIIPKEFIFTETTLTPTKNAAQLFTFRIAKGVVTTLVPECSRIDFKPRLTKATYIDDRRFNAANKPIAALAYMVTNEIWPPTNSDFLQALYEHEINVRSHMISTNNVAARNLDTNPVVRRVIMIFLLLPSLIFVAFLPKLLAKNKQNKKNGDQSS